MKEYLKPRRAPEYHSGHEGLQVTEAIRKNSPLSVRAQSPAKKSNVSLRRGGRRDESPTGCVGGEVNGGGSSLSLSFGRGRNGTVGGQKGHAFFPSCVFPLQPGQEKGYDRLRQERTGRERRDDVCGEKTHTPSLDVKIPRRSAGVTRRQPPTQQKNERRIFPLKGGKRLLSPRGDEKTPPCRACIVGSAVGYQRRNDGEKGGMRDAQRKYGRDDPEPPLSGEEGGRVKKEAPPGGSDVCARTMRADSRSWGECEEAAEISSETPPAPSSPIKKQRRNPPCETSVD